MATSDAFMFILSSKLEIYTFIEDRPNRLVRENGSNYTSTMGSRFQAIVVGDLSSRYPIQKHTGYPLSQNFQREPHLMHPPMNAQCEPPSKLYIPFRA